MSTEREAEKDGLLTRFTNALDCCGTCAGGVLAQYVREAKAEALRETANAWTQGGWSDVMLPKPTPPAVPVIAYSNRVGDWLRERADDLSSTPETLRRTGSADASPDGGTPRAEPLARPARDSSIPPGASVMTAPTDVPSRFDFFDGYYSVRFSGAEFARFAPSPVWSEYAKAMTDDPNFSYVFVSTAPEVPS